MSSTNPIKVSLTAPESPAERRKNLRFPFTATLEAMDTKTGAKIIGRTSDLSLGGCYVDTLSPFAVGTDAKIRIQKEKVTFEAHAKVVFSSNGMGMGLAFVSAQPKQLKIFQKWLMEISGQSVPEEDAEQAGPEKTNTLRNVVLSDLIMTLMQKKVLSQDEGKDLLRKLFR